MSETVSRPNLQLVVGGRSDDTRAALRELYTTYGGSVFGRCPYLLRDRGQAEDAMQDVFAKALTHWGEFRNEASPLTWLIRIATHHCLNVQRAERAPWHQRFARQERARAEGHGGPQLLEDRDAVRKLLGELDLETQQAAIHYFVDEMTLEEVARALGRSVPTIRKRLESVSAMAGKSMKEMKE
jgi:RNA polymerase sigma-70 factor (ECF subfamily)